MVCQHDEDIHSAIRFCVIPSSSHFVHYSVQATHVDARPSRQQGPGPLITSERNYHILSFPANAPMPSSTEASRTLAADDIPPPLPPKESERASNYSVLAFPGNVKLRHKLALPPPEPELNTVSMYDVLSFPSHAKSSHPDFAVVVPKRKKKAHRPVPIPEPEDGLMIIFDLNSDCNHRSSKLR